MILNFSCHCVDSLDRYVFDVRWAFSAETVGVVVCLQSQIVPVTLSWLIRCCKCEVQWKFTISKCVRLKTLMKPTCEKRLPQKKIST